MLVLTQSALSLRRGVRLSGVALLCSIHLRLFQCLCTKCETVKLSWVRFVMKTQSSKISLFLSL
jgi:hypothetical protein